MASDDGVASLSVFRRHVHREVSIILRYDNARNMWEWKTNVSPLLKFSGEDESESGALWSAKAAIDRARGNK